MMRSFVIAKTAESNWSGEKGMRRHVATVASWIDGKLAEADPASGQRPGFFGIAPGCGLGSRSRMSGLRRASTRAIRAT